ncbi:hypothetical protein H8A97_24680 [Bradyrhizobium sp. Arg62]|uniref:hypothetical protein n=1 Tax=Bradyrhizobium brasilense TaxID=1419277 RepID=UPI001E60A9AC|nr:hypothetical protein [Bradyrhizobium brasilense]MCC8948217.1 hypothetical protein [Bradyrhizobium brasilense]
MSDPHFSKMPSNLDAIFKAASQLKKFEGLAVPEIPPGVVAALKAFQALPKVEALQMPQVDLSAFAAMQKNALAVFPEWQRQVSQQMQPMADLQRQMRQIALPPQHVIDQFNDAAKHFRSVQFLAPTAEQLEIFKQLSELEIQKRALERIGLLPHRSMPVSLLAESDDDVLRTSLQQHYTENWERISDSIRERVNSFAIDDEAKAVMGEALEAHRNGHYRSVCRLLLPEIERVARVELEGNRAGPVNMKKVMVSAALDLPLSETRLNGYFALQLFDHLADHLYVHVDEKNRLQLEQDPVPNRHAAIHGIVVYRSFWNSLNVIFMTDFAFQIMAATKEAQKQAGG